MAAATAEEVDDPNTYDVQIQTRDGLLTAEQPTPPRMAAAGVVAPDRPLYRIQVR